MIAYLIGNLTYKDPTFVIVETQGIGYQVKISLNTYSQLKDKDAAKVIIYQHITELAHTLFGFADDNEKSIFLQLISVSGVGPSTALMVLSSLSSEELEKAILSEDVKTIQAVKGIGLKTAQRLILELKDKIKKGSQLTDFSNVIGMPNNKIKMEALAALQTLGFPKTTAEKSIDNILQNKGNVITLEELIKLALKSA